MDISNIALIVHTKDKEINFSTHQNKIGYLKHTGKRLSEFIQREDFDKFISEPDIFFYLLTPTTILYVRKEELAHFKLMEDSIWSDSNPELSSFYYDPAGNENEDFSSLIFPINKSAFISSLRATFKDDRFIDSVILNWIIV